MIWQGLSTQQSQLQSSGAANLNFSNAELVQQLSAIAKLWSVEQSQQQLPSPTARITDSPTSSTSSAVLRKHSIPSQIQQQQSLNNTAAKVNTSRYKTELCRPFGENGHCKYGDKCQFAHGDAELRQIPRHPKYKSEKCRTYHTSGFCPYGPRCHFVHNEEDLKKKQQQAAAQAAAAALQQQQQQAASLLAGSITNPAAFAQLPMYTPPPASELPKLLQMRLRNASESDHMSVVSGSSSASSTSSDVEQDLADNQHHGFAAFQNLRFAGAAAQQATSAGSSLASSPSTSGSSSAILGGSRLPVFAKLMN